MMDDELKEPDGNGRTAENGRGTEDAGKAEEDREPENAGRAEEDRESEDAGRAVDGREAAAPQSRRRRKKGEGRGSNILFTVVTLLAAAYLILSVWSFLMPAERRTVFPRIGDLVIVSTEVPDGGAD